MSKLTLKNKIEKWIIFTCVDHEFVNQMEKDGNGDIPITFTIGGVELDWDKVVNILESNYDDLVTEKAQLLLNEKYGDLINEIFDIQERIGMQKERFKWEHEEEE